MTKVLDTFLFSEAFEADLLFLKIYHENSVVDQFVGIESEYTFRGQHKGCHLQKLLDNDPRLFPYLDKIKVVSIMDKRCRQNSENEYCRVSDEQRGAAESWIFENFTDDDVIMLSDVDEFIDGTHPWRAQRFNELVRQNEPLSIERIRYWYDYDNYGSMPPMEISIPIYRVRDFKSNYCTWRDRKWLGKHIQHHDKDYLAFEYSSCFDRKGIYRKHDTFAHDCVTHEWVDKALRYNCWPCIDLKSREQHHWFKKVQLTEANSTQYIVKHLKELKTNAVDPNYEQNRAEIK